MTLTLPPDPLPILWARSIANSIASELRRGWRTTTAKRANHPTGNPTTRYAPGSIPPPHETTEHLWTVAYAEGITDPTPDAPYLAWHLRQLDLAEALHRRGLMDHHETVNAWLKYRPASGPTPAAFITRPNRHGHAVLRRNADHTPEVVALSFLAAAEAATVRVPDPIEVDDFIAEHSRVDVEAFMAVARPLFA